MDAEWGCPGRFRIVRRKGCPQLLRSEYRDRYSPEGGYATVAQRKEARMRARDCDVIRKRVV
jgi:hypothetical protein